MMIRTIVVALASLTGCGGPLPIHIHANGGVSSEEEALVDEAVVEVLGLEWEPSDRGRGAIHLTLHDGVEGHTYDWGRCHAHSNSGRNPRTIAHELGHALGLEHNCEDDECTAEHFDLLMNGLFGFNAGGGMELTDEEIEQLEDGRRRWAGC